MENPQMIYDVKVSLRCKIKMLKTIKDKLLPFPNRLSLFRNSVFGRWLDYENSPNDNHVLNFVLQHQVVVDNPSPDCPPLRFKIGDHELQFGRYEFCLVTGFRFGSLKTEDKKVSPFCKRVFPQKKNNHIKSKELYSVILNEKIWAKLDDLDAVRVCLLFVEEVVFMGREEFLNIPSQILTLVEDLYLWNTYPWGELMWVNFYKRTVNHVPNHVKAHISENGPEVKNMGTYNLNGFVLAFKTWILESYPNSSTWWTKERDIIPRSQAWKNTITFRKSDYPLLFGQASIPILELQPTEKELKEPWFRRSFLYIKGEEAPFIQEIRPVVDINSIPVSPRPNVRSSGSRDLLNAYDSLFKEIVLVRPDFTGRVVDLRNKLVEKICVQPSTQKIDGASTSRQTNYEEFVTENGYHDTQGSLQDLVKILEPEFAPEISCIQSDREEQHDFTTTNKENVDLNSLQTETEGHMDNLDEVKENDVMEDLMDYENQVNYCLDDITVDYEEDKFNGDINVSLHEEENLDFPDTNFEPVEVTTSVISLGEEPIIVPDENKINGQEEPVIVEDEDKFNGQEDPTIVADEVLTPVKSNAIVDLDVFIGDLEIDGIMDCPIHAELEELVDKKISSQSRGVRIKRNSKKLVGCRKKKPGPQKQSPYVEQDPTTPLPAKKQRTLTQDLNPVQFPPLTTCFDGVDEKNLNDIALRRKLVLPFVEDLRRPKKGSRVTVPPPIKDWLEKVKSRTTSEKMFKFLWDPYSIVVDDRFFIALLGLSFERRGWLSSSHLELWVELLWLFRPEDADWSVAGPYFCPTILGGSMPCQYAIEKKYSTAWLDVERVFFPLNEPDTHWALAELHFQSGVITVYDSMTPRKRQKNEPIAENRLWWRQMREILSQQLPKFLDTLGLLKKRGLNVEDYKITFEFCEKVPHQGEHYGDCGIWVCLLLHRLVNNIPLVFGNPLQVALAFREQMALFFWKYKVTYALSSCDDENSSNDTSSNDTSSNDQDNMVVV